MNAKFINYNLSQFEKKIQIDKMCHINVTSRTKLKYRFALSSFR